MNMKEDKQEICTAMCNMLRLTRAAGLPENNPLAELRYIMREDGTEIVRPIFEDGVGKNGWYDVNVTGTSGIGMVISINKRFINTMW